MLQACSYQVPLGPLAAQPPPEVKVTDLRSAEERRGARGIPSSLFFYPDEKAVPPVVAVLVSEIGARAPDAAFDLRIERLRVGNDMAGAMEQAARDASVKATAGVMGSMGKTVIVTGSPAPTTKANDAVVEFRGTVNDRPAELAVRVPYESKPGAVMITDDQTYLDAARRGIARLAEELIRISR